MICLCPVVKGLLGFPEKLKRAVRVLSGLEVRKLEAALPSRRFAYVSSVATLVRFGDLVVLGIQKVANCCENKVLMYKNGLT